MDRPVALDPVAAPAPKDPSRSADATDAAIQAELRKKELKRQADALRPLDAWERYRALNDAMDEAFERIDMNNRETRFALILMGALNAAAALMATRRDMLTALPPGRQALAAIVLGVYAAVAGYFLLQAINGLQPRQFRPNLGAWPPDSEDYPKGVRYFEDVVTRDVEGYWQAWGEVRMSQINSELAVQVHSLCLKASVKRVGLLKLFKGLRVMAVLVGVLFILMLSTVWK